MAASAHPGAALPEEPASAAAARRQLGQLIAAQGLAVCAEPWRCEALLRDLCGGSRREIFWLMAALKENVIADIQAARRNNAEAVIVARLAHKLSDNLGLAEEPARWTAAAWVEAVSQAPASSAAPEVGHAPRPPLPAWPDPAQPVPAATLPPGVDFRWVALCSGGAVLCGLALAVVTRVAVFAGAFTPRGWLTDTGILGAGLALCALAQYGLMRGTAAWPPRRRPAPGSVPWALVPELLLLMAQPAVLVVGAVVWFGGWVGAWHYYGAGATFAFHLGRLVQTIILALFFVKWLDWMTRIQGRVASTLVGWP